jgi:metal-dependent amidase/aminoacylase/carboxypeptidase family protein
MQGDSKVRSFSDVVREHLLEAIDRKARAVAFSNNAPEPSIKIRKGTPALYNDPGLTERVTGALLLLVPACKEPTVMTAGSTGLISRLTIVCNSITS